MMRTLRLLALAAFGAAGPLAGQAPATADSALAAALRAAVQGGKGPAMRWPDLRDVRPGLRRLYEAAGWRPLWTDGGQATPAARALVVRLDLAAQHGLDPADYDVPRHDSLVARLDVDTLARAADSLAAFDVRLTADALRFLGAIRHGRVRLVRSEDTVFVRGASVDVAAVVDSLRAVASPHEWLERFERRGPGYERLLAAYARFRQLAADTAYAVAGPFPPRIATGTAWAGAPRLRTLLAALGDLDLEPAAAHAADHRVDAALAGALRRFQGREGLPQDGVLGSRTRERLARPFETPLRQLALALERWRGMPEPADTVPYVDVNVPEYRLRVLAGNAAPLELLGMGVVVGMRGRHETPELADEIEYLVFRPYWEVTRAIMRDEIVPKALADSTFLDKNDMELWRGKEVVPATPENLALVDSGVVRVRQRPGPGNSLGGVKFMLPNRYNVYLHDTPLKNLFRQARRAASHGCVRVADAGALAAWLLRRDTTWTRARIDSAMTGKEPLIVPLPARVPVRLRYGTANVEPDGHVRFFQDLYGRDALLAEVLATGYPYPGRPLQVRPRPARQVKKR